MKVLHASDWHIGQKFMGKSREEEHKAFLSWVVEIIKSFYIIITTKNTNSNLLLKNQQKQEPLNSLFLDEGFGTLEHKEYLAQESIDPREQIAKKLLKDIPSDVIVLAYNMSFEKGVIKKLAALYPELSTHLLSINENMKDLMIPFQKKYYVTPSMNGSYSIKYVLPALVPELAKAYKELDGVQNGNQAMNAFANMSKMEEGEKERMRTALIEYCKLDTLAMVKILEKLKYKKGV